MDSSQKKHVLDNKCSQEFKEVIAKNGMKSQLVPPIDHRRNAAEKAIYVLKDHFVVVLCGADVKFPMGLWCRILRQADDQLNLLRKSRVDPTKSSFECLHGNTHNCNVNPFAPPGCVVEIHVMSSKRRTWEEHKRSVFYIGNLTEHCRCHDVWITNTHSVRVGQTIFFKHKYLTQPSVTTTDAVLRSSDDLCQILKGLPPVKGDV